MSTRLPISVFFFAMMNQILAQPVSNNVNLQSASYRNDIGQALLGAWWRDPDFDASERAFYYVRVLEIPTPTWYTP